ncbi:hypothetical protein HHK36_018181 [Tetracentron sinense]|uniref:Uncharacterized protein n=1 Tax=Tetracentron sinense TaxID=13715 RepID=A0A835DDA3_TETSI|nr:hypothetical protein HHK36_018181 [Tetracentron sinense]
MGSKWRKVKIALGLNMCLYVPRTLDEASPSIDAIERFSDSSSLSPSLSLPTRSSDSEPGRPTTLTKSATRSSDSEPGRPTTLTKSASGICLLKSGSRSSKKTCAICLTTMKPGHGHAIFTAECSHTFHFHCITSNVKHGNQICPVCRAKWKEIPFQGPSLNHPHRRVRINSVDWPQDDAWMTVLRRLPPRSDSHRHTPLPLQAVEPSVFNDDEPLDHQPEMADRRSSTNDAADDNSIRTVEIKTYPEVSVVPRSASHDDFTVLIHLKAPFTSKKQNSGREQANLSPISQSSRAPVDLVTVLDVSGSMAGTKLALLKRAMGFVIQNLRPSDRLSVIAFSSTARRLFPLRRMSDTGRQQALQAVNFLISNGGTNIAEGLRKGAKVMEDRKEKNPVGSIILLSDGQDTYSANGSGAAQPRSDYQSLLPFNIRGSGSTGFQIPVHAFGFGVDHDAASMHSISETSGGTFSFIETEGVIQDAFAQCIGGLLSVVVQKLQVGIECLHPGLRLGSLKAGSYPSRVMNDSRTGYIDVGDMYADEERDFLVSVNVPVDGSSNKMSLLKVRCVYRDPVTKETVTLEGQEVGIQRPEVAGQQVVSIEVDKQRNRHRAAEAMAEARATAERGDLVGAVAVLESCRRMLSETVSARDGDRLCVALDAELKEMQERMANRRMYEESGRAYVLSGLSSHSWQRATARGDSTDSASLVQAYQTPSMLDMLTRSQTIILGSPSPPPPVRPARSFSVRPRRR